MNFKIGNIKPILIAIIPGLLVAGFWGFASSNPKTIFDELRLPGSKIIIDANDSQKRTIIAANPLWQCGDDIDYVGQTYATIQIGDQCWLTKNLNVGTRINGDNEQDNDSVIEKWCYNDSESYCDTDGGLYQWAEAMALTYSCNTTNCSAQIKTPHQGICPSGWHVPTDDEWTILTNYLSANSQYWCGGNSTYIAKSLASQSGWASSDETCAIGNNQSANNLTGFTALPVGYRQSGFGNRTASITLWSASQGDHSWAWWRFLYYHYATVSRNFEYKTHGFSVRCVKD